MSAMNVRVRAEAGVTNSAGAARLPYQELPAIHFGVRFQGFRD